MWHLAGGRRSPSFLRREVQSTWSAVGGSCTLWGASPWWRMTTESARPAKSLTFGSMWSSSRVFFVSLLLLLPHSSVVSFSQVWRRQEAVDRHDQRDALRSWSLLCLHAPQHSQNAQTLTGQQHYTSITYTAVLREIFLCSCSPKFQIIPQFSFYYLWIYSSIFVKTFIKNAFWWKVLWWKETGVSRLFTDLFITPWEEQFIEKMEIQS